MRRTGLLDRSYPGGPMLSTWTGQRIPLADGVDLGDLVTGDSVVAEADQRDGWPPEVVVSMQRAEP